MNLQKLESKRVLLVGQLLLEAARHVPEDKADWAPDPGLSTAHQIVQHIGNANDFFAAMIEGEAALEDRFDPSLTYAEALKRFEQSCKDLAEAVAGAPDDALEAAREMPWGQTWKVKHILTSGAIHIAYHWGQLSHLQRAWGDLTNYHLQS